MSLITARILSIFMIVSAGLAARYLPWVEFFFSSKIGVVLFWIFMTIAIAVLALLLTKSFTGSFFPTPTEIQRKVLAMFSLALVIISVWRQFGKH